MRSHGRTTLLLFVFFQALYGLTSSGNPFRVPDEFEVYFQVEHLVDAGDISVPQTLAIQLGGQPIFFGKVGLDGKPYAPYGPLAALWALPHHLLGRAIARLAGVPRPPLPAGVAWVFLVGGLTMVATGTAAALTVAGFHRAALAMGTPARTAFLLALLLGGATVLWPYGTSFYSEALQAAAFIWAAALLLEARRDPLRARALVVAASALLTIAGLTKVTSLIFAPAFVMAALCDRSQSPRARLEAAVALSIGIALATGIHVRWNLYRFGQPFDFGYDWADLIPQPPLRAFFPNDVPRGLVVLLASPGKSIVLWAPVLVLALARATRFVQREPAVAIGVGIAAGIGLVFYSAYLFPEGAHSHGPRNLVPIIPLMLLPAAGSDSRWPAASLVACALAGVTIAGLAVSVSFLEDQRIGGDLAAGTPTVYYERVAPPPGRVWNRYRLDYVPFVSALRSPGWLHAGRLGEGPDFFPLHLLQARRQLPDGGAIPLWLVWGIPAFWLTLLVAAGVRLRQLGFDEGQTRV